MEERYSPAEERINAAIHGFGVLLGVAALVFLVVEASAVGRDGSLPAVIVYGGALVLLFLFSTLYHAVSRGTIKRVFHSLDHSGIYLLIAGTYTPFCLLMPAGEGWVLFAVIWLLAAVGIAVQAAAFLIGWEARYERVAFLYYLAMSWIPILWASGVVFEALPTPGIALLIAGGIAYSVGVVFYLWKRLRFNHAVWHLFVVAGSALHYFSVLLYIVPRGA